jgi:urease subunit beta
MIPGEIITPEGVHQLNEGYEQIKVTVANSGDRPIQVGSHYHFYEVNGALKFDRELCKGYRLDITSGTAVRFEPGQQREVTLIPYRGKRRVFGFRGDVQGYIEGNKE